MTAIKKLVKATMARVENGKIVNTWTFPFNPAKITRSQKTVWDFMYSPGGIGSVAEFVRVDDQQISFEIFLASSRSRLNEFENAHYLFNGLKKELAEIESWGLPSLDIYLEDDTQFIAPPTLIFSFGTRAWECVLTSFNINETKHNIDLNPILATVSVQLQTKHDSFAGIRHAMNAVFADRELEI